MFYTEGEYSAATVESLMKRWALEHVNLIKLQPKIKSRSYEVHNMSPLKETHLNIFKKHNQTLY